MTLQRENYLGIDWGSAKVGVALAHKETNIALPYTTLQNDEDLLQKLGEIITREHIGTVVIGIPFHIRREGIEYAGEKLGKIIEKRFMVRVAYQNEMFTTKLAQQSLIAQGAKHIAVHDDEEAARIILSEWLSLPNLER